MLCPCLGHNFHDSPVMLLTPSDPKYPLPGGGDWNGLGWSWDTHALRSPQPTREGSGPVRSGGCGEL